MESLLRKGNLKGIIYMTSEMKETPAIEDSWRGIGKTGAMAAFAMLAIMIAQIAIYIIWPPPASVDGFFQLFRENKFLGLLSMDLLYIVNNTLLLLFYLGIFSVLKRQSFSAALIALVLGVVGVAAYYSSNTAFEMLSLAKLHAAADEAQRTVFLAAGQSMLEVYKGTAFDTYYILNGIALIVFAVLCLQSRVFSKTTAVIGLLAGILMSIPSTAGKVGLIFSLLSLIPWAVFSILVAIRLLRIYARE
jgi:hypothetical protein